MSAPAWVLAARARCAEDGHMPTVRVDEIGSLASLALCVCGERREVVEGDVWESVRADDEADDDVRRISAVAPYPAGAPSIGSRWRYCDAGPVGEVQSVRAEGSGRGRPVVTVEILLAELGEGGQVAPFVVEPSWVAGERWRDYPRPLMVGVDDLRRDWTPAERRVEVERWTGRIVDGPAPWPPLPT